MSGRSPDTVAAVADELGAHGVAADLADPSHIDRLLAEATGAQGPIDVLVNNAGLNAPTPLAQTTAASLQAQLATNLSRRWRCIARCYRRCSSATPGAS